MKIVENYTKDFDIFYGDYIEPLGESAEVLHAQLFPGVYPSDWDIFFATEKRGAPPPLSSLPESFRYQIKRAERLGSPFRRLRILPDMEWKRFKSEDVKVLKNIARRNAQAGEDVRIAWHNETTERLRQIEPNPYADEYLSGADTGVSRLSFWSVIERQSNEPRLQAVRLMSYDKVGDLAIRLCLPPFDDTNLATYVDFWHDVYANHAQQIE